jgi:hypothetical protein
MHGQKRLNLSLSKRKRDEDDPALARTSSPLLEHAERSSCMVSQTQVAVAAVVDLCADEPDGSVETVGTESSVTAEMRGPDAVSAATTCPPPACVCFVCLEDISALTLLEQEVHRNSCLDVNPCEEDWHTQRVQEADDGENDDNPDDTPVVVVPDHEPAAPTLPLVKSKSAFEVLMQAARESTAAVAKAAMTAVASVTAPFRGYGAGQAARPCPFYKRIPGTPFIVDGFHYASKQLSSYYVLTHFHRQGLLVVVLGQLVDSYALLW